ncbi:S-adenosylmethionine decarboxylase proenzyme [Quillaja saponaria]|uniref:S-adenosylmethionine decarboxylase proenzyme n=1 Tax=Quillaja saponaria TaxID=32244 RepID=A0AAD7PHE7_QUISA|nr:S-adenosylmethionine decarboxylase proenzyme [Quillaja saponaria]
MKLLTWKKPFPPSLCYRKASIMPSKSASHSWHVFTATDDNNFQTPYENGHELYTMEICMTDLDPILARKFFRRPGDEKTGDSAGKEMTELTEDGFSYASYECVGSIEDDAVHMIRKVVQIFRPGTISVSTTCSDYSHQIWTRIAGAVEAMGLKCRSCTMDEFPEASGVVFQTFTTRRKSN